MYDYVLREQITPVPILHDHLQASDRTSTGLSVLGTVITGFDVLHSSGAAALRCCTAACSASLKPTAYPTVSTSLPKRPKDGVPRSQTCIIPKATLGSLVAIVHPNTLFSLVSAPRLATFYSRSRKGRWCKGETSGHFINVMRVFLDCDRDSIVYLSEPIGPACHTGAR